MWPLTFEPMKILFAHDRLGAFAGAEANLFVTATELQQRGHAVGLLHGPGTGKGEAGWRNLFPDRWALDEGEDVASHLAGVVGDFQPDLIYVHKLADLEALEALLETGVPLVRMVHDHDLYCMRSYKYNYFTRQICERPASSYCVFPCGAFLARDPESRRPKWVSYSDKMRELELNRQFTCLVVASQFMKQELARNGFAAGKVEIHPPVPRPGSPARPSDFTDRNRIIYAGQIVRGKGVDVLLQSLALVNVPFECLIFGDGHHRPHCERLSRELGLSDRVHFKGYVSQEELQNFYQEASLAVLSSVWPEPFGAVGLEGMSHGLPVVAFDAGGIREWLINGYNGFRVPWMDRAAFAARVEELLGDKALARRLGEQGRTMVGKYYAFSDYINGLEGLFARLTSQTQEMVMA
jgi:glycosyltransferase involved in cell wall biosynthesis